MAHQSGTELVTAIKAALERDTRINLHRSTISISIDSNHIVLEGEVQDIAEKRLAANLSRILAGEAIAVDDRLCVATETVPDDELGHHICRQLAGEPSCNRYDIVLVRDGERRAMQQPPNREGSIEVRVSNGVVTLDGTVGSLSHQRLAEVLCWWVVGCRRVDNLLSVLPVQSDSDNLLTDVVRIVLEKDPLVDAGQIRLGSAAGIVELNGLLPSDEARGVVLRDTWSVPGVWDVVNHIQTGRRSA